MTSTHDEQRPGRHTVTRSRRAASARKAAENSEKPQSTEKTPESRPIPGSWPAAKPSGDKPGEVKPGEVKPNENKPDEEQQSAQPSDHSEGQEQRRQRQPSEAELARREAVAKFPFVAVTLGASGIHPSTSRLISFDAVTYNADGEIGEATHIVFSPDSDPGPKHQHGLTHEEVAAGIPFSKALKRVDRVVDGRTLIVHDATVTWGFLVSEARRAMTAAARQNRSRNRNNRNRSRRIKVGHIPRPKDIIDTLATARRHEVVLQDVRLAAVAIASGIPTTPPTANVERAQRPAEDTAREETSLLWQLYKQQSQRGEVVCLEPSELRADKFGLQRSHIRVDAMEAPRMHHNPGQYTPGRELVRGMEFVVAPEIAMDPDIIIEAAMREEMNYTEKLSRETSVVICNITTDLVGKAMHADRKDIPLMSDEAFLAALERIQEAGPEPVVEEKPTTAPRPQRRNPNSSSAPRRSNNSGKPANSGNAGGNSDNTDGENNNRPQRKSTRRRRRRRGSNPNNQGQNKNQNQSQGQGQQQSNKPQGSDQGSNQGSKQGSNQGCNNASQQPKPGQNQGGANAGGGNQGGGKSSNRRRRRGGRGGRNRNRPRNQDNRGQDGNASASKGSSDN
ncbi:DNA polymerase III subunit epsilon [Corynebacteriaceae bacterium 6-324]